MPDSWLDTLALWLFPDSWNSTVPLGMSARPANRTADSRFTSSAQILNSSGQRENKQFETVPPCWLNFHLQFPYGWIIRQWHPVSHRCLPVLPPNIILKSLPSFPVFQLRTCVADVQEWCHMSYLVFTFLGGAHCRPRWPAVTHYQRRLWSV